jgi:diguanylate cyclase (GGDEF)-like protein/PAS domain S-box-containing protein
MRKRSQQEAGPRARPSGPQESPFPAHVLPVLKDAYGLTAHRPALEHVLAALLEYSEDAVLTVSPDGKIGTWSAGAERLYGYTADEITGQSISRLLPVYESPRLESVLSPGRGQATSLELAERLHKNGSRIVLAIRRSLIHGDHGEVRGILEMAKALDSHAALWSPEEAPLRLLMEQVPGLLWTTDRNLRILTHWGGGLSVAKIRGASLRGQDVREFFGVADAHRTPIAEHRAALRGVSSHFEYPWKERVLEIRVGPLRSFAREIIGCLCAAVDVTDRKRSEEQALYQARHDGLTGLANYREFMGRLEDEVRRAERSHQRFALLLLDLDELKRINDLDGHLAGDRALRRLARVMNEHCRSTDVAARYGGDEFAVLLIDSDGGMAEHVAGRIALGLRSDEEKPQLSVSIGIGVYPGDGRTAGEIIEAADQRLYHRKRNRRALSAP